jgi:hypothetical protein
MKTHHFKPASSRPLEPLILPGSLLLGSRPRAQASLTYSVVIGTTTYQVSITTTNGTRYFRLVQL